MWCGWFGAWNWTIVFVPFMVMCPAKPSNVKQVVVIVVMPLNALASVFNRWRESADFTWPDCHDAFLERLRQSEIHIAGHPSPMKSVLLTKSQVRSEFHAPPFKRHPHCLPRYGERDCNVTNGHSAPIHRNRIVEVFAWSTHADDTINKLTVVSTIHPNPSGASACPFHFFQCIPAGQTGGV